MRVAVIDLGTNTFNLLIAETGEGYSFNILFEQKLPVKLGKGGIGSNLILPDAQERALAVLKEYVKICSRYQAEKILAFGTSAIRSASNGKSFTDDVYSKTGVRVEVINGEQEADFIYHGVCASVPLADENVLILDIGGGSNEIIIGNASGIQWKKSYPLGMARIIGLFHLSDPLTTDEITALETYFEHNLPGLDTAFSTFKPGVMIGASGTFDTFASMLNAAEGKEPYQNNPDTFKHISLDSYLQLHRKLLTSTLAERKQMKGLEAMRVEMIVPASIFVNFVLRKYSLSTLIQTEYSLKEGVAAKLMKTN